MDFGAALDTLFLGSPLWRIGLRLPNKSNKLLFDPANDY